MLWWCSWENDDNFLVLNLYFLPQLCVKPLRAFYFGLGCLQWKKHLFKHVIIVIPVRRIKSIWMVSN
jgi:hypothetical protein